MVSGDMSQRHKCPKDCIWWKTPCCNNQVYKGLLPPGKGATVKKCKNKVLVRMQRKGHICTFLVGILVQQLWTAIYLFLKLKREKWFTFTISL